jgi:hypothetical protein
MKHATSEPDACQVPGSVRFVLRVSHASAIALHLSNATYFYTNLTRNRNPPRKSLARRTSAWLSRRRPRELRSPSHAAAKPLRHDLAMAEKRFSNRPRRTIGISTVRFPHIFQKGNKILLDNRSLTWLASPCILIRLFPCPFHGVGRGPTHLGPNQEHSVQQQEFRRFRRCDHFV